MECLSCGDTNLEFLVGGFCPECKIRWEDDIAECKCGNYYFVEDDEVDDLTYSSCIKCRKAEAKTRDSFLPGDRVFLADASCIVVSQKQWVFGAEEEGRTITTATLPPSVIHLFSWASVEGTHWVKAETKNLRKQ
jgi:hypothetical protein